MNREEIGKLVTYATAACPSQQERDMRPTLSVWGDMLGHLEFDVALAATKRVIALKPFFPAVAEILKAAHEIRSPYELDATEAWEQVMAQLRDESYRSGNARIERVVKLMGGWGYLHESTKLSVDRAHFLRYYEDLAAKDLGRAVMPPHVLEIQRRHMDMDTKLGELDDQIASVAAEHAAVEEKMRSGYDHKVYSRDRHLEEQGRHLQTHRKGLLDLWVGLGGEVPKGRPMPAIEARAQ